MSLCQACRRFDVQLFGRKDELPERAIPCFIVADGLDANCSFCSFLIDAFKSEYPKETNSAKLNQWFRFVPDLQPPSADTESGMGLVKLDVWLAGNKVELRTCADPGNTHFLLDHN